MNTKEKLVNETLHFIAQKGWTNDERDFFDSLSLFLADKLQVAYVMINKLNPDGQTAESLSFVSGGAVKTNISYPLTNTPCENVMGKNLCCYEKNIQNLFPKDSMLVDMLAESYIGIPLWDFKGAPLGLIALLDTKPIENPEEIKTILQIVAVRVAHEIERNNYEHELIDKTKKAEESENKFKAAFYTSPDSVSISTLNGEYVEINEGFTRISGYTETEVLGKTASEINIWAVPEDRNTFVETLRKNDYIENFESSFRTKNGTIVPALVSARIIMLKNEPFILAVTRDITERKKYESELLIAKEKAEESDRLKSAFLANMSHEIRTPMNGILGFSNLLSEPGLESEEQQAYIKIIQKSGARMLNILSEIVEISKIESGAIDLQIKQVNIIKKMESVFEIFKPEATVKSINLTLKNSYQLSEPILNTDEGKFDSILTNLVKNAIKYSDEGSIEFGYNPKEIDGKAILEFYVKDTGIGIRKDKQDAIFDRFIQADIEDVKARQGAGLGLTIVKSYVEMLGGKVWVESEMGIGSTFYFTLPYNTNPKEKSVDKNDLPSKKVSNQINPELTELKILIADDDETSLIYLSTIIKDITNNVLVASSGIETVKICQSNSDINLVLMDIQMPEMNGYEATQQIRKFNKEVIIVAQTAFAMAGDREKSIAAGCNDYISKPIKKGELVTLIQKYSKK